MTNFCSQCGKPVQQNADFCTKCGASISGKLPAKPRLVEKRERVIGKGFPARTKHKRAIFIVAGVALIGGWVYFNLPKIGNAVIAASPVVTGAAYYSQNVQQMVNISAKVENGKVILPMDVVKEKRFVRFLYGDPLSGISLLAYVTNEGKVVTAISLCEPCNSKAFHIKGDKIICNSCGTTWVLNDLEAISGSCGKYPPDALPNTIAGNDIQIEEQLIARWQRRI
jgi:uncharacterized membrane protein